MSPAFLKEIRLTIAALFLLLVATVAIYAKRQQLVAAAAEVETQTLAKFLIDLPGDGGQFQSDLDPNLNPQTQDDQQEPAEVETAYKASLERFRKSGLMEVIGQFGLDCRGGCGFQASLSPLGGGWLHFATSFAVGEPFTERLKVDEKSRKEWERDNPPKKPEAGAPERRLYYVKVAISKDGSKPNRRSDLISAVPELVFSNVEIQENPVDFTVSHAVPGPVQVYYKTPASSQWIGPVGASELLTTILGRARSAGVTQTDEKRAYLDLRAMVERQEVPLPVVGVSVNANVFLQCAFLLSLGLSAWASFVLRMIKRRLPEKDDEPSILIEPVRQLTAAIGWDRVMATCELMFFSLFHLTALVSSVAIASLVMATEKSIQWWTVAGVIVAVFFTVSLAEKYFAIVSASWRSRPVATRDSNPITMSSNRKVRRWLPIVASAIGLILIPVVWYTSTDRDAKEALRDDLIQFSILFGLLALSIVGLALSSNQSGQVSRYSVREAVLLFKPSRPIGWLAILSWYSGLALVLVILSDVLVETPSGVDDAVPLMEAGIILLLQLLCAWKWARSFRVASPVRRKVATHVSSRK